MRRVFIFLYLFIIHGILGVVLWKSDFIPRTARRLGMGALARQLGIPQVDLQLEISSFYLHMVSFHENSVEIVPEGSIIFIGDSITQGLYVTTVRPNSVNYGIGGDTTLGVLARLDTYQTAMQNASAIVVAIGVNDLTRRSGDELIQNYTRILESLPNVPIFISSILPVDESILGKKGLNSQILKVNDLLKQLASDYDNVEYIDNQNALDENDDGVLDAKFHTGDGLHLNSVGNTAWASVLRNSLSTIESK
jgi:lysophospholipase L1-like esterase